MWNTCYRKMLTRFDGASSRWRKLKTKKNYTYHLTHLLFRSIAQRVRVAQAFVYSVVYLNTVCLVKMPPCANAQLIWQLLLKLLITCEHFKLNPSTVDIRCKPKQGGGTSIYPVLWSSSSVKAKVKSQGRILVGQR